MDVLEDGLCPQCGRREVLLHSGAVRYFGDDRLQRSVRVLEQGPDFFRQVA